MVTYIPLHNMVHFAMILNTISLGIHQVHVSRNGNRVKDSNQVTATDPRMNQDEGSYICQDIPHDLEEGRGI